jgi:flagellar biogenesis protein FliO
MTSPSSRWIGTIIAIVVVAGLAIYVVAAHGARAVPAQTAPAATAAPAGVLTAAPPAIAPASGAQRVSQQPPGLSAGDLLDLAIKIGIVGVLLAGSLWALKRFAGGSARPAGRSGVVRVLDTIPLAQQRALYIVDLGERAVLIGATPQQLTFLAEIADATALAQLRATSAKSAGVGTGAALSRFFGGTQGPDARSAAIDGFTSDLPELWSQRDDDDQAARLRATAARLRAGRES